MFSLAFSRVARVAVKTSSIRSPAALAACSANSFSLKLDGNNTSNNTSSNTSSSSRFFHASPAAAAKLNVEGLAERVDLKGANVLMRVDLNVPLAKVRTIQYVLYVLNLRYLYL
jgi:hypothetical protein